MGRSSSRKRDRPESPGTNRRGRYRIQFDSLEAGSMADFEPVLSRNWNVPDSNTLRVYESRGGYQAARKALTTMDPDRVVALVKQTCVELPLGFTCRQLMSMSCTTPAGFSPRKAVASAPPAARGPDGPT